VASVFDYLDGFSARILKAYSLLGKELDSLSDLVSFGVAPAVIVFHLLKDSMAIPSGEGFTTGHVTLAIPFLIAVFSSLRLAIFNLDTRQTTSFIGLPTPANALFIVGLVLGLNSPYRAWFEVLTLSPVALISMVLLLSFLLVSPLPMFSLKIKNLKVKENWRQLLLAILSMGLIIAFGKVALSPIIVVYLLISFFSWIFSRK
jgi:CDP-diacylglycerol--serine O-phosphatidyltransferase